MELLQLKCGVPCDFKFHVVSLSKICNLISFGGLGIKNLLLFNCALLGKGLLLYATKRGSVENDRGN
jgi:hypothetical protein